MSPLSFDGILRDELMQLRSDANISPNSNLEEAIDSLDVPLSALCLSGGGIRSASFALGILQGFARFGLLGKFTYLSTVSGGGYIGSWLTAWRHHASSDEEVFKRLDRTRSATGEEAGEIRALRADSNYLINAGRHSIVLDGTCPTLIKTIAAKVPALLIPAPPPPSANVAAKPPAKPPAKPGPPAVVLPNPIVPPPPAGPEHPAPAPH